MYRTFYSDFLCKKFLRTVFIFILSITVFLIPIYSVSGSLQDTGELFPIADANIRQGSENSNFGTIDSTYIGKYLSPYGFPMRHLIQFDSTAMNNIENINQVTLNLYAYYTDFSGPITLNIHFVNSSWTETVVTWNTQPTYEEEVNTTIFIDDPDEYKTVDITQMVIAWRTGEKDNYGLILEADDHENINEYARIWTREKEVNQTKITYINNVVSEINQGVILPFILGVLVIGKKLLRKNYKI